MVKNNLSKKILMFSELIGGFFLFIVGFQGILGSMTVSILLAFIGVLIFLTGLGHSDELDRESKLQKPNNQIPGPPKDVHPNILCGTGEDEEEQKED
jgi:hypothetical protein